MGLYLLALTYIHFMIFRRLYRLSLFPPGRRVLLPIWKTYRLIDPQTFNPPQSEGLGLRLIDY
jgi:hypothetical protein